MPPAAGLLTLVLLCAAVATAQEARPDIYGCGIVWGRWLQMSDTTAKAWDRLSMDRIVEMGGTNCPANFAWIDIEPTPGVYDWDYVDHQVDEALARGLEVFAYSGLTPDWALPPGILQQYGSGSGYRFPPDEQFIPEFQAFFTALAARYRDRVTYYEFWNEPNGCSWINDGCSNGHMAHTYVPWLILWYDAMKAGDPNCVLAVGGLDYNSGAGGQYRYIEDIYANGGGDHFDAVAIHPYASTGLNWPAITDTYNVLVNHGDGHKKLWINEYGWHTSDDNFRAQQITEVLTTLKQPQYHMVFQANHLILTDLPQVPYTNRDYGLCSGDRNALTITPRQGWYAFQALDKTFPETVNFSADTLSGSAPLTVQFTDLSNLAGAAGWYWEFGDGGTSSQQNPVHTYTQEGSFTVSLTVTTAQGDETALKVNFIRVSNLPLVAFIGGQLPPTLADSQVIQHIESLGVMVDVFDDEPANRPTAAEIAAAYDLVIGSSTLLSANVAGEFRNESIPFIYWESSLGMADRESLANGPDIDGGQTQINVVDNTHPVMAGIPSGLVTLTTSGSDFSRCTGPVAPGVRVLATNAGDPSRRMIMVAEPGAALLDGGAAVGKRAFLYLYDTTWLNTNDNGKRILDNAVAWALGPVHADFEASAVTGTLPLTVDFSDTSTGPVTAWSWNFGDGTVSSVRNPSHTYAEAGVYGVSLQVAGVNQTDTISRPDFIRVVVTVPADFDGDLDVDMSDHGHLQACFTVLGPPGYECEDADLDGNYSVDQGDLAIFQSCMSGANMSADPACMD